MENGRVVFDGGIEDSVNRYLQVSNLENDFFNVHSRSGNKKILFTNIRVFGINENVKPSTGTPLNILIDFENKENVSLDRIVFDLGIEDDFGYRVCWVSSILVNKELSIEPSQILLSFPINRLNNGRYYITVYITVDNICADWIDNAYMFEVNEGNYYSNGKVVPNKQSKVLFDFNMKFI